MMCRIAAFLKRGVTISIPYLIALGIYPAWAQYEDGASHSDWIARPWQMRYFIRVQEIASWKRYQGFAPDSNSTPHPNTNRPNYFGWEEFFEPRTVLDIPHWDLAKKPEMAKYPEDLGVVVIEFDKEGQVITPHSFGKPLRGRLRNSRRISVVLSSGDAVKAPFSELEFWYLGHREDTPDGVTPALCNLDGLYESMDPNADRYVYGNYYKVKTSWLSNPPFNCREWSWQMQEPDRPYIDVTSYGPPDSPYKRNYPHGTYIQSFVGWSRFDRHKPVIGKHADTWYCLHECPDGAQPGPIPDIHAWAKANGWTSPKPPTRMPVFTDDPKRRGRYPE